MTRPSDELPGSAEGFSLAEMKAAAAEVGLDPALVERAARGLPSGAGRSSIERVMGGPVRYRAEAHFDRGLSDESAAQLLSVVRASVDQRGEGQADSAGMSWHSVGAGSQFLVNAHADGDRTTVRIAVDRSGTLVPVGMFTLLGTLAVAVATILGFEVIELQSQLLGWSVLAGTVLGSLGLGRAVWASSGRRVQIQLDHLMDNVSRLLAPPANESPTPDPSDGSSES